MITLLFFILLFGLVGKLTWFAFKATWGILKVLLYVVFFPLVLVGLVAGGLMYLALPILIIAGLVSLVKTV